MPLKARGPLIINRRRTYI